MPPTVLQLFKSKLTQLPVDATQHAPVPEPQSYVAQVVPALWEVPPNVSHSEGDKSKQELSDKQQALGSIVQFIGVYEERIIQSPLGVHIPGNC